MNKKQIFVTSLGCALLAGLASPAAFAADDFSISAGLKVWNAQWQANSFPVVNGVNIAAHADSGVRSVTIPLVSVRYRDFGISASRFMESSFTLADGFQVPWEEKRVETDLNVSYALMPGLSASLGSKEIKWNTVTISGPTLALSASAPIGSGFGLYGTGGIGWLEAKSPGAQTLTTDYVLGEFGMTYAFDTKPDTLKGLTATMGYRYQKVTAKSFALVGNRDVNDITSGVTFSLIGRF